MSKDEIFETTFDPKSWAFKSCGKGHTLIAGDQITVSSPTQMYGGKTVITSCPVCRGERADVTPPRPPPGPFTLTIPADLYDELPQSTRDLLYDIARRAQARLLAPKRTRPKT